MTKEELENEIETNMQGIEYAKMEIKKQSFLIEQFEKWISECETKLHALEVLNKESI